MTSPPTSTVPWFTDAWQRTSISVPGAAPVEPCSAWWLQTEEWFVDVRVTLPGHERNTLPYSQTRAFAGRFEIVDGEVRWHLLLDTAGLAPRTDRADAAGLYIAPDDPTLMIEDAPGRFVEQWRRRAADPQDLAIEIADDLARITVRVGEWVGTVAVGVDGTHGTVTSRRSGATIIRVGSA